MASKRVIAQALKMLSRVFSGTVDELTVDVYCAALEDLTDADVERATAHVIRTVKSSFMPTPAVLREIVTPLRVVVDADSILRKIAKELAHHSPTIGMSYPSTHAVETHFGPQIAYAYAAAGGPSRLYANDETSRDIAAREFQKALQQAAEQQHAMLPVLAATSTGIVLLDMRRGSLGLASHTAATSRIAHQTRHTTDGTDRALNAGSAESTYDQSTESTAHD
jgi:hypothetical protein